MKKILLVSALALLSGFAFSATTTITNSGFEFSPDDITIDLGDTVVFQLTSIHNAVEVSEATWNANGNTPLPGFSVPFGGGQVTGLAAGVHYYVCTPHASGGMKGKITVVDFTGIDTPLSAQHNLSLYPNPTTGKFTLENKISPSFTGNGTGGDEDYRMEIYNQLGERIIALQNFASLPFAEIDLTQYPAGIYFVRIYDRKKIYTQKLVKK